MERVYIGLGSNLADPQQQLRGALQALAELPGSRLAAVSSSMPATRSGPPTSHATSTRLWHWRPTSSRWRCSMPCSASNWRRAVNAAERWGPRTLDLDILLFGERLIDQPRLQVPHYHMQARAFVLYPLAEIAPPELVLADGRRLVDLLRGLPVPRAGAARQYECHRRGNERNAQVTLAIDLLCRRGTISALCHLRP